MADFFDQCVEKGRARNVNPKQIANYLINQKRDITHLTPEQLVSALSVLKIEVIDEVQVGELVNSAIDENPILVEAYRKGKTNVLNALIGQVMRKSSGKANSLKVKELLEKKLGAS